MYITLTEFIFLQNYFYLVHQKGYVLAWNIFVKEHSLNNLILSVGVDKDPRNSSKDELAQEVQSNAILLCDYSSPLSSFVP